MKKFLSIFLAIVICFSSVSVFALDSKGLPDYKSSVKLGRSSWSAETHNGTICYDKEGNPLMCYTTQGGFFWVIDLLTGHVKERHNIIGDYTMAHLVTTAPNGSVYIWFYPGNCLNVYDPIAGTIEALPLDPTFHTQDGGCITEDEIVYGGSYEEKGARVLAYDIKKGDYKYYGPFEPNCTYVKGITYDDKYIYAGTGYGVENCKMFRIDKETGERTVFLTDTGSNIIYTAYMINNKIIAHTNGNLHIVDPKTLEKENTIRTGHSRQGEIYPSPYNEKEFYHFYADALWKYNTETKEHTRMVDCLLDNTLDWAELPNGDWVLSLRTNTMEKIGYYNPKTNAVTVVELDQLADAGPSAQTIEVSPEGVLYCGGYQSSMGVYNINTNEFIASMPKWHQNEGTGFLNGKVYFGTYTDAVMFRYDPERPLTTYNPNYSFNKTYQGYDANPSMVYDIEKGQDRPFVITPYNNKLYIGTISGYNVQGGAFTILEEENGVNSPKAEIYHNIIPNQSISGIAVKGNLVYIGSTIRNGLGTENTEKEAKIAVFNLDKKEVIDIITPDLPGIGTNSAMIGELTFGSDGLLWGVSDKDGLVFALDPETFEVKKYVATVPGATDMSFRPYRLRWGDDGLLYTTAGWKISVIDPETMEYKRILDNGVQIMTLDHNGNIWYARGEPVFHIDINQYDRLTRFLKTLEKLNKADYTEEEWTVLQNAINEAKKLTKDTDDKTIQYTIRDIKGLRDKTPFVKPQNEMKIILNGEELSLDYDTTGVTKVYNGRTLVPYRALLETLGYKVTWDVHKASIKAEKDGSNIQMALNDKVITFNGVKKETDVPPVLLSGRQYVPIRFIAEELGYEVIWNEKENAVEINK